MLNTLASGAWLADELHQWRSTMENTDKMPRSGNGNWGENKPDYEPVFIVDVRPPAADRSRSGGTAVGDNLGCANRASLIRQLLNSVEIICESATERELRFMCGALGTWRTLNKRTCLIRVPKDSVELVKRYLAWVEGNEPLRLEGIR